MRKPSKAKMNEFRHTIEGALIAFDAAESQPYWQLQTPLGTLDIRIDDDDYTVFGRFHDAELAKRYVNCNSHSGKWNFYGGVDDSPGGCAAVIIAGLFGVMNQRVPN